MADYHTTAVAFDDLKNAALYFDHVIPVSAAIDLLPQLASGTWKGQFEKGILPCLPPDLARNAEFLTLLGEVNVAGYNFLAKWLAQEFSLSPRLPGVSELEYEGIERSFATQYFTLIDRFGLRETPIASSDHGGTAWMADEADVSPTPVVIIAGLRVVDASAASWEHIHELRRDPVAKDKLRRLRLFAFEKYVGRNRAFVEDDLLCRVSEYDDAVRQWGLETVHGTLTTVLGSKLAASVAGGTLLTSLFAQPTTVLISAAVGATIEVGHIGIEFARRRFAMQKLSREAPVSFISYTRSRLAKNAP